MKGGYKNMGYSINNNNYIEYNPYIRDKHGFTAESEEYKEFIDKGIIDHGAENSYEEASKFLEHSADSETFKCVTALYTCKYCNLMFKHPKRFLIHCKWHTFGNSKDVRTGFPTQDSKVVKASDLMEGEKTDEGNGEDTSFECDICNQIYKTRKSLTSHKSRVHLSSPKDCKICNKTFSSLSHLRAHLQTHNEGGTFPCSMCPKKFKFLHSLQRHIPTHSQEKNHQCEQCEKSFGSELLLKIHSKTHMKDTLDKNLKCSYCSKCFHQAFRLTAHERTHTGVRPFQCGDCNQSYPTNSSLNRHRKVSHSSDFSHMCTVCGKGFHIRSALEHHTRRSHLKQKPYQCSDCGNSYTCQSELAKHCNKAHNKACTSRSVTESSVSKIRKKIVKRRKKEYSDDST